MFGFRKQRIGSGVNVEAKKIKPKIATLPEIGQVFSLSGINYQVIYTQHSKGKFTAQIMGFTDIHKPFKNE
jgi:hypothetical protein